MTSEDVKRRIFSTLNGNLQMAWEHYIDRAEELLAKFCAARLCEPDEVSEAILHTTRTELIVQVVERNPEEAFRVFAAWRLTR